MIDVTVQLHVDTVNAAMEKAREVGMSLSELIEEALPDVIAR